MNIKEVQDLIKFVAKSGVSEVEIEQKEFKIIIKSEGKKVGKQIYVQPPTAIPAPVTAEVVAPIPSVEPKVSLEPIAENDSKNITIKSPMIGTFYRSSGPEKDPFVSVGDSIESGDIVCIIEAMKLFNEIEGEIKGKIVKVLVDDATPVEYDQPLFLVEPY